MIMEKINQKGPFSERPSVSSRPSSILIVDDEEIVRESCIKILSSERSYRLLSVASAEEALSVFEEEEIDLIITDLKLPDMDGIELLKVVRERDPNIEVIMITGYGTVDTAVQAMKLGAYDYIEKPFRPDELLALAMRALEKKRLREENLQLRRQLPVQYIRNIIGQSKEMERVFELISSVAPTSSTVLITGESGTGKELVARAIHYNSPRRDGPFVVVDCGTLPDELIESELFGHRRGAFTGAVEDKKGLIEEADGGTLFLDEIGNLPLPLQTRLLRVLQEKEFRPLGGKRSKRIDVRFIAATNRDLKEMVREGSFREDLYYRLNIFPIRMPPLRERRDDIPLLAYHFLKRYSQELGKEVSGITAEAMKILIDYEWPGNVRELENTIQRAILITKGNTIRADDLGFIEPSRQVHIPRTFEELKTLKRELRERSVEEVEREFVLEALRRNEWNVSRAARDVGMLRPNFHALMKKYSIARKR